MGLQESARSHTSLASEKRFSPISANPSIDNEPPTGGIETQAFGGLSDALLVFPKRLIVEPNVIVPGRISGIARVGAD
jgi:hypothetical protein